MNQLFTTTNRIISHYNFCVLKNVYDAREKVVERGKKSIKHFPRKKKIILWRKKNKINEKCLECSNALSIITFYGGGEQLENFREGNEESGMGKNTSSAFTAISFLSFLIFDIA